MLEQQLLKFIKEEMTQDLAHDINHVLRVVELAKKLAIEEGANLAVILPAAYLHDCFSFEKNHPQRSQSSLFAADKAIHFLQTINYPDQYLADIHHAILTHSYSANIKTETLEAQVVQDADRLDALGAIGIARCIQVSCKFNTRLYSTEDPFCEHRELDDKHFTVDHFYNKLFKLELKMNTQSGKEEAQKRTEYMKGYLAQLANEISS
ncbi:HD domain-containing protein [Vibrio sp. SS-MA-C1-2]|uniref:HD domain-containing protein n=1 Tax=Vibrio sp. SS-MA-C1-2 TaxID=2908646 RepID=UPI001F3274C5|nr:HD domain-containing protein [Vibrio sp. SS-MA-C1-2]UJF19491.1 HD domain-containing protein [Vibrio sp. SS-MA-C1-2]